VSKCESLGLSGPWQKGESTSERLKSSTFWDITVFIPLSQQTFQRNTTPQSSGLKLHVGVLFDLLFSPEDVGNMFFRNLG
jgi:hypothetical protein